VITPSKSPPLRKKLDLQENYARLSIIKGACLADEQGTFKNTVDDKASATETGRKI